MSVKYHIIDMMKENGLHVRFLHEDKQLWSTVWNIIPYQPNDYAIESIDYHNAYLKNKGMCIHDISVTILNGDSPIGIWPLTLIKKENKYEIFSCYDPVWRPLFLSNIGGRRRKRMYFSALKFLRQFSVQKSFSKNIFMKLHVDLSKQDMLSVDEWQRMLLSEGGIPQCRYMLYLDLRKELSAIRSGYRKSYKSLINKGRRLWQTFIMDTNNSDLAVWHEFKNLHLQVTGRQTRSDETWALQYERLVAGKAFLVGLRDPKTKYLVGAGYFCITRDEGVYAVAAYNRSLFDKPLGHVVQDVAVMHMKNIGLKWYKLGERFYSQLIPPPTEKEISISLFKEGFASHMFAEYIFSLPC